METSLIIFKTVIVMVCYMAIGFCLVKGGLAETSHARSFSGLLMYVLGPCLIISSFLSMGSMGITPDKTGPVWLFFITALAIQVLFFLLMRFVLGKRMEQAKYRIMAIGAAVSNSGFFGLPVLRAAFPDYPIVAAYSSVYTVSLNLVMFTIGVYMLTGDKKHMSLKTALTNPNSIGLYLGVILYYSGITLPETLGNGVDLLGKMSTPVCMLILGMRLASMDLKKLFNQPFVYYTIGLKEVVLPLFAYAVVSILGLGDPVFRACVLILASAPTAAVLLAMAEIHNSEQELAANVVLLASILAVVFVPLISLVAL